MLTEHLSLWLISFQCDRQIKALKDTKFLLFFLFLWKWWLSREETPPSTSSQEECRQGEPHLCLSGAAVSRRRAWKQPHASCLSLFQMWGPEVGKGGIAGKGKMNHKGVGGEVQDVVLGGMKTCNANPQETRLCFLWWLYGTTCLSEKKRGDRAGERSWNGFWLLNIFFYLCIISPTSLEHGGSYNHISSGRA